MKIDILLEGICSNVDERIDNDKPLEEKLILEEYGLPETREYKSFVRDYVGITEDYLKKKNDLTHLVEEKKSPDLERVFWNSAIGGATGILFSSNKVFV